jgi:DNA-binding response OmpR family regulator
MKQKSPKKNVASARVAKPAKLVKTIRSGQVSKTIKKPKILLVEDDNSTRESVIIKLRLSGFEVVPAENGPEALAKLRQEGPFAAVLLDLIMPGGDGFNFLKEKRADKSLKDIKVIIFSNLSQKEHIDRAAELGASGYWVKAHHSLREVVDKLNLLLRNGEKKNYGN